MDQGCEERGRTIKRVKASVIVDSNSNGSRSKHVESKEISLVLTRLLVLHHASASGGHCQSKRRSST
jgi:hypothetical protein